MVKAKFKVEKVVQHAYNPAGREITMTAAYGTEGENASWSKATPSGTLNMIIDNPDAAVQFSAGDYVYLTLEVVKQEGVK